MGDWNTVMHLAEAAAMIIFGVGAWAAQRKAGETTNATDISKLAKTVGDVQQELAAKVGWKDFDRALTAERRITEVEHSNLGERIERVEKKVFNGDHRG